MDAAKRLMVFQRQNGSRWLTARQARRARKTYLKELGKAIRANASREELDTLSQAAREMEGCSPLARHVEQLAATAVKRLVAEKSAAAAESVAGFSSVQRAALLRSYRQRMSSPHGVVDVEL